MSQVVQNCHPKYLPVKRFILLQIVKNIIDFRWDVKPNTHFSTSYFNHIRDQDLLNWYHSTVGQNFEWDAKGSICRLDVTLLLIDLNMYFIVFQIPPKYVIIFAISNFTLWPLSQIVIAFILKKRKLYLNVSAICCLF